LQERRKPDICPDKWKNTLSFLTVHFTYCRWLVTERIGTNLFAPFAYNAQNKKMDEAFADLAHSPNHRSLFNARCSSGLLGPSPPFKSCDHAPMCCFIAPSQDQSGRLSLRLFVQLRTPVQTRTTIRTTSPVSGRYFSVPLMLASPEAQQDWRRFKHC
jgi:hypothetical protein